MLSACSWDGIALQREQLKADAYCAAPSVIGGWAGFPEARQHTLSCSGAACSRGLGRGQDRDTCKLGLGPP